MWPRSKEDKRGLSGFECALSKSCGKKEEKKQPEEWRRKIRWVAKGKKKKKKK